MHDAFSSAGGKDKNGGSHKFDLGLIFVLLPNSYDTAIHVIHMQLHTIQHKLEYTGYCIVVALFARLSLFASRAGA